MKRLISQSPYRSTALSLLVCAPLITSACSSEPTPLDPPDAAVDAAAIDAPPAIDASPPPPPLFSHERGFYSDSFELVVSPDSDDIDVYYTLDGRDPDGPTATQYTGPITIDSTTIARFSLRTGGAPIAESVTHTYILPHTVPDQSAPAGYPAQWWQNHGTGPWPADYEMDSEVVDGAGSAQMFPRTFYSLPAVSVTLDPDDLFGPTGIHENSYQEDASWVRVGSFEVLKHESRPSAQINCGVRIFGRLSRDPDRSPKKSFQIEFDSQYGPDSLQYSLYDDTGVSEFHTVILRAGYNRTWVHSSAGQRRRSQYVRESFAAASQRDMGHLAPRTRVAHLFLNGLYWGLYLVQERPDADFQAVHVGGAASEYDTLDAGDIIDGDRAGWDQMMAIVESGVDSMGAYQSLQQWLDLENFADYVLLQHYLGNTDWPENNWYAARQRTVDGRFHFFNWDAEAILGDVEDDVIAADEDDSPGRIFQALRANPEFLIYFADRINKHLANGGALTPARGLARWDEYGPEAGIGVFGESARWGDHLRDDRGVPDAELYTYSSFYVEEAERIEEDVLPFRSAFVIEHYRDAGVFPQVDAPLLFRHGGSVPAGYQLSLLGDGPDRDVFYTLDGSDPRLVGGAVSGQALIYAGTISIESDLTLKARVRTTGGAWSALTEADFTVQ